MTHSEPDRKVQSDLKAAFDELLASLAAARDAIDDPELKPPPSTARNLSEGYRYLMGYLGGAVERAFAEDTDFPYFRRAIPPHDKSTWDNADALYLSAPIDGTQTYRIRGRAPDTSHWRGGPPAPLRAPRYVIFSAITHYTGDTGSIAELVPEVTGNTGQLDSGALEVAEDGSFEVLLAPERPAGHRGNFVSTRGSSPSGAEQHARWIICREVFGDWEHERNLEVEIVNLARLGAARPAIAPADAAARVRRVGEIVNHQMRFWNDYFATILDGYGKSPVQTPFAFPKQRNRCIEPKAPSATVGAAQATNIYAGGIYDLAEDEALILEQTIPEQPIFTGINLNNIWGESHDYANYVSSLNDLQSRKDSDGKVRYVIAHRDPGAPNWLDTTGLPLGMLSQRWAYHEPPNALPTVETRVVPLADVFDHLPAGTPRVSPEERREQVRIRQEHVQRRFCQT